MTSDPSLHLSPFSVSSEWEVELRCCCLAGWQLLPLCSPSFCLTTGTPHHHHYIYSSTDCQWKPVSTGYRCLYLFHNLSPCYYVNNKKLFLSDGSLIMNEISSGYITSVLNIQADRRLAKQMFGQFVSNIQMHSKFNHFIPMSVYIHYFFLIASSKKKVWV